LIRSVVSKRYAKAIFDLVLSMSKEDPSAMNALDILKDISISIDQNPPLKNILFNPSYGTEEKKKALAAILKASPFQTIPTAAGISLRNFFFLLIKKNKLALLTDILERIEELKAGLSRTTPVTLTIARNLSGEEQEICHQKIETVLDRRIMLTVKIVPEILGGVIMQIGSKVFDASVKMRLSRLRDSLIKGV